MEDENPPFSVRVSLSLISDFNELRRRGYKEQKTNGFKHFQFFKASHFTIILACEQTTSLVSTITLALLSKSLKQSPGITTGTYSRAWPVQYSGEVWFCLCQCEWPLGASFFHLSPHDDRNLSAISQSCWFYFLHLWNWLCIVMRGLNDISYMISKCISKLPSYI